MQTINELHNAIHNATMFAEGATAMLEHEGRLEWNIWLKVSSMHSINLIFNGLGRPQATLYRYTHDGIDHAIALDLFH